MKSKFLLTFAAFCLLTAGLSGQVASTKHFIQLSVTPDIALVPRTERIEGFSLGLWSENPQKALALGIANGSTGESSGFSWAFILNYAESYAGVHWAAINYTRDNFFGWQAGFVNYAGGNMRGLQTAFVNHAGQLTGLQWGFLNYAETAHNGVQIGLVNIIPQNEWFSELPDALAPGMIFVNWRF